ncbi:MAG TPA: SAM-dependent methyltransferase [Thermoanaerobaculia bacterium]
MATSLKRFLAAIAVAPDALVRFLVAPESAMADAGVGEEDRELWRQGETPALIARLAAEPTATAASHESGSDPGPSSRPSPGSLTVVGTGIRSVGQLTVEAIAHIQSAERVFYLVAEPVAEEVIHRLNPAGARSLAGLYGEGKPRRETYRQMVESILTSVRHGRRTCAVFYGHPGVFVDPAHEAVRSARKEGFAARMLPGVSAEDCLFADLGLDPATAGCQSYEATDFLVNRRQADPSSHLVLWQVGVLGDRAFSLEVRESSPLDLLIHRLSEVYPRHHQVCVYEAAVLPACEPVVRWTELAGLERRHLSIVSTLYVPPAEPPRFDPELYFAVLRPG